MTDTWKQSAGRSWYHYGGFWKKYHTQGHKDAWETRYLFSYFVLTFLVQFILISLALGLEKEKGIHSP